MMLAPVVTVMVAVGATVAAAERVAAVVYRGTPAGTPRLDDLAAIRALGFSVILWPSRFENRIQGLREMAATVGLEVIVGPDALPMGTSAGGIARIETAAPGIQARAWRALQQNARVIAFDSGAADGAGLDDTAGGLQDWVGAARATARQLAANAALFENLTAQPAVTVIPENRDVLVSLFEAGRSWLLVASNAGPRPARLTTRLPPALPAALWISLLDGSGMSMAESPGGPNWTFEIEAGAALVYVIDRTP